MTIAAAVLALRCCQAELVDVDALHGGAEAFLTIANAVLVIGLWREDQQRVNNSLRGAAPSASSAENEVSLCGSNAVSSARHRTRNSELVSPRSLL